MIKRIRIENFQSHRNTELKLSPGVNMIVGESDSGKSAIIRALRWIFFNVPLGDSFRSSWGGDTRITVEFDNGVLVREKTNTTNKYILNGLHFSSLKNGIPEEVKKFLNVEEINFQQQLDPPFLLSNTSGEISQYLNRIVKLDKIDISLSQINTKINKLKEVLDYKEKEILRLLEELKSYDYLDKAEIEIEVLEELEKKRVSNVTKVNKITILLNQLRSIRIETEKKKHILTFEETVNSLLNQTRELRELEKTGGRLRVILSEYVKLKEKEREKEEYLFKESSVNTVITLISRKKEKTKRKESLSNLLKSIRKVESKKEKCTMIFSLKNKVDKICALFSETKERERNITRLTYLLNKIKETDSVLNTAINNVTKKEKEFLRNFPSICPLCGKVMKK